MSATNTDNNVLRNGLSLWLYKARQKYFYLVGRPIVFPWYTIDLTTETASSLSSPPAGFRKLTSGYATMVHGRGCNPHRCTTTFANVESTSLCRHWWRHNSETIRDRQKGDHLVPWNPLSYPMVKTASLYDNFCKTGNYVIYDVIIWVQDGNCKKCLKRILVMMRCTI